MERDYYRILGLPKGASMAEIKRAYREKAKEYHPDINDHPRANEAFVLVNEAYSYLSNPVRRATATRSHPKKYSTEKRRNQSRQWAEQEKAKARQRAEENANMSFEEFAKKPIYKAAMVLDEVYNYIFIAMGVVMIVGPIISMVYSEENSHEEKNYFILIFPVLAGISFIYAIWYFAMRKESKGADSV